MRRTLAFLAPGAIAGTHSAAGGLALQFSPQSAKHARLLRLTKTLAKQQPAPPNVPQSDGEQQLLALSQIKFDRDVALSKEEETLREALIPLEQRAHNAVTGTNRAGDNMFYFRDFPMFPGEVIPPEHQTLSSVRKELQDDLTVHSLKEAWFRVAGGMQFRSVQDYYRRADGLDEVQLREVVAALFPSLTVPESAALIRRTLEAITNPHSTPARDLSSRVSAESLGLDAAPGHYSNFLEWMARMMDTSAFKTEHAIYQFARRKFNRQDVRIMFENYHLLSTTALQTAQSDGYSHFYEVLKDFALKVSGEDTRAQVGVRIDPQEMDPQTGFAFGLGKHRNFEVIAMVRENRDGTGNLYAHGKTLQELLDHKAWMLEVVLTPFDEAGLNFKDFDVYFVNSQKLATPNWARHSWAAAARLGLSTALTKLLPLTRINLKKAGYLTFDRTRTVGDHPGFLDGKFKRRPFRKR